jgi:raffinose/stachyose/melibiose transport system permease protein
VAAGGTPGGACVSALRPAAPPEVETGTALSQFATSAPTARRRRHIPWGAYVALVPTVGLLAFFAYYPDVNGLYHSLTNWEPGFSSPFVGLANYRAMWHDGLWWQSFVHIGIIFAVAVTAMWAIPLAAAELLITLSRPRWRFFFRALLIAPLAFSPVIQVLTWEFIYDPNVGVLNHFLGDVGLASLERNWLGDPSTALGALIFVNFPWVASLPFLIFSSGLQNIPAEIFDAAAIDGAGRWRRFLVIDLPLLLRQIKLLFFLAVVNVLQYGFAAYIATQGGPDNATTVPILRMVGVAFDADEWGYAAALSTTLLVVMVIFSGLTLLVGRRRAPKGARA